MLPDNELKQQIQATAELLNLSEYVIEKDYFLTKAIEHVIDIKDENYKLIFQGGTSLSKAYNITNRMSEDSDFRIQLTNDQVSSKEQKKRLLKEFRKTIIAKLRNNNFKIDDEEISVFNEGRFMSINATYPSAFAHIQHIKPFLALDFFLGEVRTKTELKLITTLIKQTFKDKINHPVFKIECVSIIETAAEKWVALTRRIANISHRPNDHDRSLIRHLYDIFYINKHSPIKNEQFIQLVDAIITQDKETFKTHNEAYYQNPMNEIKRALTELTTKNSWRENWDEFIEAMVFNKKSPSYANAVQAFVELSNCVIQRNILKC